MRNLLYAIVLILVTAWSIAFIGYGIRGMIHILPVIAILAVTLSFIRDKRAI